MGSRLHGASEVPWDKAAVSISCMADYHFAGVVRQIRYIQGTQIRA